MCTMLIEGAVDISIEMAAHHSVRPGVPPTMRISDGLKCKQGKRKPPDCSNCPDDEGCSVMEKTEPEPRRKPEDYILEIEKLIKGKQKEVPSLSSDCTIYRVPETLAKEKPEAYIPHLVSIGPFNRDQHPLQPMEGRKMRHFNKFLRRTDPTRLVDYIEAVTSLEARAHRCYPEVKFEPTSFAMMMVVDGCFILELLQPREENASMSIGKWSFRASLDLILLANQLPFFVLEALYQVFIKYSDTCSTLLSDLIREFLHRILGLLVGEKDIITYSRDITAIKPKHLLDFVRQFLIPENSSGKKKQKSMSIYQLSQGNPAEEDNHVVRIPYATELKKAGVKFKKNENPTSLLDINFDRANGVLTIPGIKFGHETELILRNLVVYEQYTDDYSYITEYTAFLDGLIDTGKDVELLQKSGIIESILGDTNEVARLFNNLLKDVAVPFHYTVRVRHEVEQYYNIPWHKWKASLMLKYFNTPWSFISLVAAIILLILTFIQTFYTVKPYIR